MKDLTQTVLAVERAMTDTQREAFLARFWHQNPSWRGSHVADILDALMGRDAHLAIVEPMHEAHEADIAALEDGYGRHLFSACAQACCVLEPNPTWEHVRALMRAVLHAKEEAA